MPPESVRKDRHEVLDAIQVQVALAQRDHVHASHEHRAGPSVPTIAGDGEKTEEKKVEEEKEDEDEDEDVSSTKTKTMSPKIVKAEDPPTATNSRPIGWWPRYHSFLSYAFLLPSLVCIYFQFAAVLSFFRLSLSMRANASAKMG